MELLEAVNTILPYMGEHLITRIETTRHPTVDLIVNAIARSSKELLTEGQWFNTSYVTLPVNTDGQIDAPSNALTVYGLDCRVSIRGGRLYNLDGATKYFTTPVRLKVIEDMEFKDLPELAASTVMYSALIEVYVSDFGVDTTIQAMQMKYVGNRDLLSQENIRNRRFNSHAHVIKQSRAFSWIRR